MHGRLDSGFRRGVCRGRDLGDNGVYGYQFDVQVS